MVLGLETITLYILLKDADESHDDDEIMNPVPPRRKPCGHLNTFKRAHYNHERNQDLEERKKKSNIN